VILIQKGCRALFVFTFEGAHAILLLLYFFVKYDIPDVART